MEKQEVSHTIEILRKIEKYWTKMIRKHKNNLQSIWALVNKLFSISHERWERFGRTVDGYHVSRMTGKLKSVKTRDI